MRFLPHRAHNKYREMAGGAQTFPPPLLDEERPVWGQLIRRYLLIAKILVPKNTFLKRAEQTIGDLAARAETSDGSRALQFDAASKALSRALAAVEKHRTSPAVTLRPWDISKTDVPLTTEEIQQRDIQYAKVYERISSMFNVYAQPSTPSTIDLITGLEYFLSIPSVFTVAVTQDRRIEAIAARLFSNSTIDQNRAAWNAYIPPSLQEAFRGISSYIKVLDEIETTAPRTINDEFLKRVHETIRENTDSIAAQFMAEVQNVRVRMHQNHCFKLEWMTTKWLIDNCGVDIARARFDRPFERIGCGKSGRAIDRMILVHNQTVIAPMYQTVRTKYINEFGFT